ncbi:hypothetical protein HDR58_02975 [bacterium]|nr:hypothetical protein [bacterium]
MLKNIDKYDNTAHFSYNESRKKPKKGPNKDIMIFVSVFFIGVLIILGFAKILSPNVDVAITNENELLSNYEEETSTSVIDDRLKHLQMEDSGQKEGDEEMFSPELDEKVVLPTQHRKTVGEMEAELADKNAQKTEQKIEKESPKKAQVKEEASAPAPYSVPEKKTQMPSQPSQIVNAKVVVGYYATEKQAEVAKSIIQDAGLGVTPVVKNLGGYYTLQVGAYTSREKAQQAANSLLKSNFPARVITD